MQYLLFLSRPVPYRSWLYKLSYMQFSTDKAPKPVGLYPHARRAGNLLFLSGVGPRKAGTDEIPGLVADKHGNHIAFDFEAQCRSVFDNVRVILEESGSSWDKLIDVTVFLVDMKRDFQTYIKYMPSILKTISHAAPR